MRAQNENLDLALSGHDEVITDIDVAFGPNTLRSGVDREWLAFSPEILIQKYGQPSRVNLALARGPFKGSLLMFFYYDNLNFVIEYVYDTSHNKFRFCPLSDGVKVIRLWIGDNHIYPPPEGLQSIEETTTMHLDIDTFSKLMTGKLGRRCFRIMREVFP